jgi:hypothetical protein
MEYMTIEAQIDDGRVTVKEPDKLPKQGRGLLIVLPSESLVRAHRPRKPVQLPLIQGDGLHLMNPSKEELDASLWD